MTDYTKSGSPIQGGRGISKRIRDEFASIETAVNSKSNIASPTFTGNPTAPTASLSDSSTSIATTAFVSGVILAASLPGQTVDGEKRHMVSLDGTASWEHDRTGLNLLLNNII